MTSDFRWKESYESLGDAIERLGEVLEMGKDDRGVVADATIQRFEFTFELLWKTFKRFLSREGIQVKTPRETLVACYQIGWIDDEELWLKMLEDRNETSHIYDKEKALEIYERIRHYHPKFQAAYQLLTRKI